MAHDDGYHPRLVVTEPSELAGTVLTFDQSQLVIGHSDTADLVLEDRFVAGGTRWSRSIPPGR